MICPGELSTWAERILDSLDETGITTSSVVVWMSNHLYLINTAIGSGFYTNGSGYIEPDFSPNVSGLYESMYVCYYYNKKANSALGAFSSDWTEIEGEKQGKIRRVSRNEVSKTYRLMAQDCRSSLAELIKAYNENDGTTLVGQVLMGDRGQVADHGLMALSDPVSVYHNPYSVISRSSNHD